MRAVDAALVISLALIALTPVAACGPLCTASRDCGRTEVCVVDVDGARSCRSSPPRGAPLAATPALPLPVDAGAGAWRLRGTLAPGVPASVMRAGRFTWKSIVTQRRPP